MEIQLLLSTEQHIFLSKHYYVSKIYETLPIYMMIKIETEINYLQYIESANFVSDILLKRGFKS